MIGFSFVIQSNMAEFFKGLTVYFLPLGFGPKRIKFLEEEVRKRGGRIVGNDPPFRPSHIVVDDSVASDREKCLSALKNRGFGKTNDRGIRFVKASWVSKCLRWKRLTETEGEEVEWMSKEVESGKMPKESEEGKVKDEMEERGSPEKKKKLEYEDLVCSMPSTSVAGSGDISHPNQALIDELEKLANAYLVRNDKWRSHAYRKAINAVTMYKKKINSFQEARNIPGIGDKMAGKLMEIVECGKLRKREEIVDEKTRILESFCKVWGAGPSTAEGWYARGCRQLEHVQRIKNLTRQQQIGLKYYRDLLRRIPREEVEEIFNVVRREAGKISRSLSLELVGSYRRGKFTCGDVDIMIVNSGGKSSGDVLIQLTDLLRAQGYLTEDLVNLETSQGENNHRKYMGIFKLEGKERFARRLDLFVVPEPEKATALVHYTGSALYNRNVRLWASKKGMTLTEHGLYADTLRTGVDVTCKGRLIPTATEEDVFRELGLPYKVPEERDH